MAINTGTQPSGQSERVFAEAPAFPSNIGKIDVKGIYDRVTDALNQQQSGGESIRRALTGDSSASTAVQQGAATRGLIPAETTARGAQLGETTAQANLGTTRADFLAGLQPFQRENVLAGRVPGSTTKKTTFTPDGRVLTTEETTTPAGGGQGPALVNSVTEQAAPHLGSTVSIGNENPASPGLAPVTTTQFYTDANGVRHELAPTTTVDRTGRTTFGQAALGMVAAARSVLADPNAGAAEKAIAQNTVDQAQGMINKLSQTAPNNPAQPKAPVTSEAERIIQRIADTKNDIAQAAQSEDPNAMKHVQALRDTLGYYQTTLNALNTRGQPVKKGGALGALEAQVLAQPGVPPASTQAPTPQAATPAAAPAPVQNPTKADYDALQDHTAYVVNGTLYYKNGPPPKVP